MSLHYSFSGKKVLVTGGGQGVGRQLVQRFHDDGATVFTIDKNPETIQKLKKDLPSVTAEVVDIGDWDKTRKVVESFGVIDHLVNNAAFGILESFLDITQEAATAQFNVNLLGTVNCSQVVAKGLIKEGRPGSIVNTASIMARVGSTPTIPNIMYAVTKAGIENLTKSMAIELGQYNIRVNAIAPGAVDTPIHGGDQAKEYVMELLTPRLINKRLIEPNEIVDLVMFLLSPLSTMVLGETILIDAGLLCS